MEATGMDPGVSSLAPEKGHPLGLTEAGEELKPPENFFFLFLLSITQKTELIRILHFPRTWVNQGLYAVIFSL